jgi:hypothetical protein
MNGLYLLDIVDNVEFFYLRQRISKDNKANITSATWDIINSHGFQLSTAPMDVRNHFDRILCYDSYKTFMLGCDHLIITLLMKEVSGTNQVNM